MVIVIGSVIFYATSQNDSDIMSITMASTSTSGIEVHVESDKGWAISINDGHGLKENPTPAQYNQIANIVNDALNEHY